MTAFCSYLKNYLSFTYALSVFIIHIFSLIESWNNNYFTHTRPSLFTFYCHTTIQLSDTLGLFMVLGRFFLVRTFISVLTKKLSLPSMLILI